MDLGTISGNFEIDLQSYNKDSVIGASAAPEKVLSNSFLNLIYSRNNFSAGIRYEAYLNPIKGFEQYNQSSGIPYRYATYTSDDFEVTAGNYYEQFGTGLILRTYEERQLGIDNSLDGVRVKVHPVSGVFVKGVIGKQRAYFDLGPGIVRGLDMEVNFNDLLTSMQNSAYQLQVGGSVVSKYQRDNDPVYNLPENVAAFAGRVNMSLEGFSLLSEYAYKINDPSLVNNYTYNPGTALYISSSYSQKGLGITLSAKRIDNMNFRSDRSATVNKLNINYLPPVTRQHTFALPTLFPYGTQPNGEVGGELDVIYQIPKGSSLGGQYGIDITMNYSRVHALDTTRKDEFTYTSKFPGFGNQLYYQDFNIEVVKKWSSDFKTLLSYVNITYDKDQIEGELGYGLIYSQTVITELTYKISPTQSIRTEIQHMWAHQDPNAAKKDAGNWLFGLAEYSIAPLWYFTLFDQYNYGNDDPGKRIHYYSGGIIYAKNANRVSLSYGRQRQGLLCVGGVCRVVPASNGFSLTITSSF